MTDQQKLLLAQPSSNWPQTAVTVNMTKKQEALHIQPQIAFTLNLTEKPGALHDRPSPLCFKL